ncbi:MAG: DEAD/DEAH box helicase family protein [Verrucomicrobiales bacterium]|nr:DEAD/DEAH box helicase family protein [Verrucomicrobiales bacterium]
MVEEFGISRNSVKEPGETYRTNREFSDYVLLDRFNRPIAVVEAKRSSRDPIGGERQAADYADAIREKHEVDPFIFLANGNEIWFWHRKLYPPRKVSGFYTEEDLARLAHLDKFGQSLVGANPLERIVNRAYQIEAVKTIAERIEEAHRKFLLVLATGTGKTRVTVSLVELLQRQERIKRVLFLADRRELVKQALGAFKEHHPNAPRAWIEGGGIDDDAEIHLATYPGMMGIYQKLSVGYYDLIIADESHRSIYNRYKAIFDHFDSLQLGLTATPTDFIDHNTFELFNCPDDSPSFYYSYEEAIRDKYLVPYRVLSAKTGFQLAGLKPGELPDEAREQIRQQGIDPEDFSFEGTDLEKKLTNTGTNDSIVREFMDKAIPDASGTLPAKTIVFSVSHNHAKELYKSFNRLYPDLQRRGFAKIIDSHMERADSTLEDFKNKDFPRVAISVDMLDTGVDVPSIRNLVFAKPVFSQVKFFQMIGRGTRTWTDPVNGKAKDDFLIIDHWDNFAHFQVETEPGEAGASEPLPTRLFRLRLEKYQIVLGRSDTASVDHTRGQLQRMLAGLPLENINVAPHAEEIRCFSENHSAWEPFTEEIAHQLGHVIAPLLRFSFLGSYPQLQFENQTELLALASLRADEGDVAKWRAKIVENLALLPTNIPEVRPHLETLAALETDGWWNGLTCTRCMEIQETFAPLMRFRNRRPSGTFVKLTLPDEIARRQWITFGPAGEGAFAETYRAQVEALIRELADNNPALQRLKRGEDLDAGEIESIAAVLNRPDLFVTEDRLREAYDQPETNLADFLKLILDRASQPSREESISQAFDEWVRQHPRLTATQLLFVRTLRKAILQKAEVSTIDSLRVAPFNSIGDPEALFDPSALDELLVLARDLAA